MTAPAKRDATKAHYGAAAALLPGFTVMNYGFTADESSIVSPAEPEHYCLRLYEHAVRDTRLRDADVLEVSSGRGGGAAFLARTFGPRRFVGVDLSDENVRLARERYADANLEFVVGDAEALDLPDESFDVVVNVEASHLYDDRAAFYAEVARVLRRGGRFCYVDGCWRDDDPAPQLGAAGFRVLDQRDITGNVIRALELDNERRSALVDAMPNAELKDAFRDWSGVVGYRAYRRLADGEARYFSYVLERSQPTT